MKRYVNQVLCTAVCTFLLLACGSVQADETAPATTAPKQVEKDSPSNPFPKAVTVPPGMLDGGSEWLNTSTPIDLKDLRGKIVVLDFWTYCCINCIHVLPDLKYLEDKYEKELVVIGVHSAKFANEKLSDNIRDAILRYEIKHPVVNDNEMKVWRKFGTRAWPTLALIDPEGKFAGAQGGEGNRELFDTVIGKLVDYHRWKGTLDETPIVFDLESNRSQPQPLRYPGKILADSANNRLFISDSNHNRIVVTDLLGNPTFTIGSGKIGRTDGGFETAEFDHPQGMELVGDTLYIADTENHLIRKADLATKTVETLAGTGTQGRPRQVDGDLKKTALNSPWALCHTKGMLYIAMAGPHQIWSHKIGSDTIEVHAGNAREDVINGPLSESSFAQPSGLTANADGSIFYVADSEGSSIRSVATATDGKVTTIAGTSELDRGQSLFAFGDVDAVGKDARLQHPLGVAFHDGNVYVADTYNHKIKKIDVETGQVTTWLGTGKAGEALEPVQFNEPSGLSIANDNLFIADTNNHRILKANLNSKETTVVNLHNLAPPEKTPSQELPDLSKALMVAGQDVAVSEGIDVSIDLAVPTSHKLNTLAPVTWEVFLLDGEQIVSADALNERDEANVEDAMASLTIPLTKTPGTATIAIEVTYGYCSTSEGSLCRLAKSQWKIPLTVSEDAEPNTLELTFPQDTPRKKSNESDE